MFSRIMNNKSEQAIFASFTLRDKWYNIKQICDYTNLSESTLRRLIDKGRLRCSSATGKLLFKLEWVDKCLGGIA